MSDSRFGMLASFLRPHRPVLVRGFLLGLVANAVGLATPLVAKWVIDSLGRSVSIAAPIGALLGLIVVGAAIGMWQWVIMGTVSEQVVLDARTTIVRRYFGATVGAITGRPPGELAARVTSDATLLHDASASAVGLINSSLAMVATLVLMGFLDPVLLAVTLGAVVVVAAVMIRLMPGIAQAQEAAQESVGRLGGNLEGALRAIRTVKASQAEARQTARILADAQDAADHRVRAARRTAMIWTISWTGIQLAIILILAVGAWRAERGLVEISSLIAFLLYAFQLLGPITELTQNVTALQSGLAAAGRIREIEALEAEPIVPLIPRSRSIVDGPVLSLRGVTASYGPDAAPAVLDVDLDIPRRGHTAIVGPSGAGKTTLFSLLLRFMEPTAGQLSLDGVPYHAYSPAQIRSRLGYVEQETPVVPGSIRDNLLFTHPSVVETELVDVLAAVDLSSVDTTQPASNVSGGQRQRIGLARAIVRPQDVLLLDEATAQIDAITEAAIHQAVRRRAADGAVVTIAHRLSTVLDADLIVVMEAGRVRAQGTHDELMAADDLYRRLIEALRIATVTPEPGVTAR